MKRLDLKIGAKYNRLTILENIYENHEPGKVLVRCDCGNEYITSKNAVKRGNIKQCLNCWRYGNRYSRRRGISEMSGYSWGNILRNAKIRNIEVTITKDEAYELFIKQNKKCALTGLPLNFDNYKRSNQTASLDRIDSTKGYTLTNVQWIHKDLNRLKNKYTIEELMYWLELIKNHYSKCM